jgi:Raf kinase inhibitor-like YbhB/YbcL family protein
MVQVFMLMSSAFPDSGFVPALYTCDGEDISPPMEWRGIPAGTASLVLVCDDPDAPGGSWIHWILYNIPATTDSLPEGLPTDSKLPDGSCQGFNSWGRSGYGGPCPPSGTHRYVFTLYALDTTLDLPSRVRIDGVRSAMEGHIAASTQLTGTYSRRR